MAGLLIFLAHASTARAAGGEDDEEGARPVGEIVVTARRLDTARAAIEPSLGASTYALSNDTVETRPGGEAVKLSQVMLQMPGVALGPAGQLRVRAQANLQYRIDNIIIPQGFSDPADTLRARFADKVELVTGALPAQYGLDVGGVVNITSKSGVYERGGEAELYAGSHGRLETALEGGGSAGGTNLYATGSFLRDDAGLSAPDGAAAPPHDRSEEVEAFALAERVLSAKSRLSLIAGISDERRQLPVAVAPFAAPPWAFLGAGGAERNASAYAVASWQHSAGGLTFQVSGFAAWARLAVSPDRTADLARDGLAESVADSDTSAGLQVEGAYKAGAAHTLRAGVVASWRTGLNTGTWFAYALAAPGTPLSLTARERDRRIAASGYVEDEWRPLESLTVNLGLRLDDVTGGGAAASPRLSVVWRGRSGISAHLGYARYFVPAPPADEAGWPTDLAGTSGAPPGPPGALPRAETDEYFDLGAQWKSGGLTVGADAYLRNARNLIDERRVGETLLRRPFNFARGRARGVELEATYETGRFSAWASLALARTEARTIVTGQAAFTPAELAASAQGFIPVADDQRATASLGLSWRWRALLLTADGLLGSGLPRTAAAAAPDAARLPGGAQADLSAVYEIKGVAGRPLFLRLDLINVLDSQRRLSDGTSLSDGAPQWAPRRRLVVGLEQSF
ncbi:MAG TPA: TonB-dependent receptor [Caulobacteraceae bacterium]|nr:TonB-dependent receptor [Caulobacteraceae bacterium]